MLSFNVLIAWIIHQIIDIQAHKQKRCIKGIGGHVDIESEENDVSIFGTLVPHSLDPVVHLWTVKLPLASINSDWV